MGALAPGAVIGNCRIEGVVGHGGMGVVYRARQLDLDREVALKVVAPALTADPEARARFLAEARAAAAVEHPAVVPVHGAGEHDGAAYLVMRFVAGDDLRTLVRRDGPLPADRAAAVCERLGDALDAIHRAGYVHRDVKPQNVLLDEEGHVYLSDFGLAKAMDATRGETDADHWVGTLDYVSPEQVRGRRADARSDVYALGGVLHFMLTGRVPYPRESDEARLWAQLHEPPPRPSAVAPDVPAAFDGVVASAMAKDPELRYESAGALARAARAAAHGEAPTGVLPRPRRERRRLRVWPAAVALAAAAAAAVLLLPRADDKAGPGPSPAATATASPTAEPTQQPPHVGRIFNDVGNRPRGVVVAGGRLWIISHNHKRVFSMRLNGTSRRSIPIGWGATDIIADGDDVWVTFDIARKLVRINARTREVEVDRTLDPPPRLVAAAPGGGAFVSLSAEADAPAMLMRCDHLGNVLWQRPFEKGIASLAWARGRVWVAEATRERVYPVTPDKTVERHLNVESEVEQLAYGDGRLWASTKDGDAVEYSTMNLRKFIFQEFRGSPAQIAVADGRVFIARKGLHRVAVVRLRDGIIDVVHEIRRRMPRNPYAVTFAAGHIWVTSFGEDSLARVDW